MNPEFWHKRWSKNEIGFHETDGNHLIKAYFSRISISEGGRVFVPLCGKTRDIAWLLSKGCKVVAVELSEQAVQQLFSELGAMPQIEQSEHFTRYYVSDLSVYVGDFFQLTREHIAAIDLIYDRAALVALPDELRIKYTKHLRTLLPQTPQLVICYEYDQALFNGPPFSVSNTILEALYAQFYAIELLHHERVKEGFRGQSEVFEAAYQLHVKSA